MSIEKDLKQNKPFGTMQEKCLVNIMYTCRFIESNIKKLYKSYGITGKQYNILRILRGAGKPISTQVIRDRMIDRMSDISRIVDRLVDKDFVSKCINKEDKRLVDVTLSQKGKDLLETIDKNIGPEDYDTHNLSHQEAETLNKLLDKIRGYN